MASLYVLEWFGSAGADTLGVIGTFPDIDSAKADAQKHAGIGLKWRTSQFKAVPESWPLLEADGPGPWGTAQGRPGFYLIRTSE